MGIELANEIKSKINKSFTKPKQAYGYYADSTKLTWWTQSDIIKPTKIRLITL